jgi:hypothetical protein
MACLWKNFSKMRFFWLLLSTMKCTGVHFTHIYEWKRHSPSFGSSGSPGWSLEVKMVALGSASMIRLPLSSSGLESEPASVIQRLSLQPHETALSDNQQCYAKGSYGSQTTSWYLSLSFWCPSWLVAWTGCLDTVHICSVLCSMCWGHPFLDCFVRGSQAQTAMSFV